MDHINLSIYSDDPTLVSLCQRYWDFDGEGFVETVAQIESDNPLTKPLNKVVSENCSASSPKLICSECSGFYTFKNRTEFLRLRDQTDYVNWVCHDCQKVKEKSLNEQHRNVLIRDYECEPRRYLNVGDLTARSAILLRALIIHSAREDMSYIEPVNENQVVSFSPSASYTVELLREMYHSSLIHIHPYSNLSLFEFSEDLSYRFNIRSVPWKLCFKEGYDLNEFSVLLSNKISSLEYIETSIEEVRELSFEIALHESIAYLEAIVAEYGFEYRVGSKTIEVLKKGLGIYSVAQMYNFIWRAGKDAAAYYQRANISKRQASNSIVGSINKALDQSVNNNWDVKPYRRRYDEPQSVLSQVVFNQLLLTDDGGFNRPIVDLI